MFKTAVGKKIVSNPRATHIAPLTKQIASVFPKSATYYGSKYIQTYGLADHKNHIFIYIYLQSHKDKKKIAEILFS